MAGQSTLAALNAIAESLRQLNLKIKGPEGPDSEKKSGMTPEAKSDVEKYVEARRSEK
jgi:hypothetical protein